MSITAGSTTIASLCEQLFNMLQDLPRIMKEAFYLARTGRPGPVLVDVPKDIQQQLAVPDWSMPMAISGYMSRLPQPPKEHQLKRVVEALHGVSLCATAPSHL